MAKIKHEVPQDMADGEMFTENTAVVDEGTLAPKVPKAPAKEKVFTYVKDPEEGAKFAPQCMLILKHIKANNKINLKDLCTALDDDPNFKTRQPTSRIISYYQKHIVAAGLVTVE